MTIPITLSDGSMTCIISNPTRFKLIKLLINTGLRLSVSEIAERLNVERSIVCFHLNRLEENGFIKTGYEITKYPVKGKKGKAKQCFSATNKIGFVLRDIQQIINELKKT